MQTFHPGRESEQELHTTPAHLAAHFDLEGPNYNCLTACAASSQAIGEATELIRHGDADLMLAGGSHSMIHPLGVTGFNLLTALSTHNDEPAQGVAAVRSAPRRLRARRRGRHAGAGGAGARPAARRHHLRRADRLRLDRRRLPRDRQPSRGPRRHRLHRRAPSRTAAWRRPTSATSTPTAPAPRSTTASRRWRSRRCSATAPIRCRSAAARACSAI